MVFNSGFKGLKYNHCHGQPNGSLHATDSYTIPNSIRNMSAARIKKVQSNRTLPSVNKVMSAVTGWLTPGLVLCVFGTQFQ